MGAACGVLQRIVESHDDRNGNGAHWGARPVEPVSYTDGMPRSANNVEVKIHKKQNQPAQSRLYRLIIHKQTRTSILSNACSVYVWWRVRKKTSRIKLKISLFIHIICTVCQTFLTEINFSVPKNRFYHKCIFLCSNRWSNQQFAVQLTFH